MGNRPDIIIKTPRGRPIAVVEVTTVRGLGSNDAADWHQQRRNEQGLVDLVRFFLLVTREAIYLWDHDRQPVSIGQVNQEPTMLLDLPGFIAERIGPPIDHHIMLMALFQWLLGLAEHGANVDDPSELKLTESGFVSAIGEARFELEPAA
jgi:hypothetical protein